MKIKLRMKRVIHRETKGVTVESVTESLHAIVIGIESTIVLTEAKLRQLKTKAVELTTKKVLIEC